MLVILIASSKLYIARCKTECLLVSSDAYVSERMPRVHTCIVEPLINAGHDVVL